jgi:glycyl-tRNA synthetase
MDSIINLCKKTGYVFQSSDIYGSMAGFYDYGPLGVELKNNIKNRWWRDMVQKREDIVGLDSSIIGSPSVWKASGHIAGFSDPMVDCKESKLRFRADQVFWAQIRDGNNQSICYISIVECENMAAEAYKLAVKRAASYGYKGSLQPFVLQDLTTAPSEIYHLIPSPASGVIGGLTPPRDFNLMFQTNVGAVADDFTVAYLRPETAQVKIDHSM